MHSSKSEQDKQQKLKEIALDYIYSNKSVDVDDTRSLLENASRKYNQACIDLYKSIPVDENDPFLIKLLNSFNIAKSDSEKNDEFEQLIAKSKNFYELLNHLCHNGHHQIEYFIILVNETHSPRNWPLIFLAGAALTGGTGLLYHFKKEYFHAARDWIARSFPLGMAWLGKTFSVLRNIPLLGIFYNSGDLAYAWYSTATNGTHPTSFKLNKLLFKTLQSTLAIAAYTLTFLSGGALVLPVGLLFVTSAAIDVIKSAYVLVKSRGALKSLEKPTPDSLWVEQANYERAKNLQKRSVKLMGLELWIALLVTGAVVVGSFSPPGIFITASCFAFITLLGLAQQSISNRVKKIYVYKLQEAIAEIPKPEETSHQSAQMNDAYTQYEYDTNSPALESREPQAHGTNLTPEHEAGSGNNTHISVARSPNGFFTGIPRSRSLPANLHDLTVDSEIRPSL